MDRTIKLIEEFISSYNLEGVCRIWADNEVNEYGNNETYWVHIVLDLNHWLTKSNFIIKRMEQGISSEIRKWFGLVVGVDVTFEECGVEDSINENISQGLKRRITVYDFNEELRNVLDYEINAYLYKNVGDFISDVCDNLVNNLIDSIPDYTPTPKEKDDLYYYFVDKFSSKIKKEYDKTLKNRANESVKKIIVTESQYKRLFEQKQSKIEVFQDLINDKLEYIRGFCSEDLSAENYGGDVGFGSCDDLAVIDSIKVDEVNMMTSARTDMSGNLYDSTPSIYIKLTIDYTDIGTYSNFDDIVYDLKHILKKSTGGLPIIFDYRTKNLNKNKEW
jgi:hypothetical protein